MLMEADQMTAWKVRGLAAAMLATAAAAVALVAPGGAAAACSGANIEGNGASVEANAHKLWEGAFNAKCVGTEQVKYISTSSSKGVESWNVGKVAGKFLGFGPNNACVATDTPPNAGQEGEILEKETLGSGAKVLTIPVLQFADALPIHLPEGCTASSGKGKKAIGRLVLSEAQVQGIFAHTITTWAQLVEGANEFNEDKLVGASCDSSAPIVRVVRKEGAGTTSVLEKVFFEINKNPVDGSKTWNVLAEETENTLWPDEAENLVRGEKNSGVISAVVKTAGSIGYANLPEVRANTAFTTAGGGGEGTATFWPEVQSDGKKFADPSTDGDSPTVANANCAGEDYVSLNGEGKQAKFPPESTEDVWNEVTASATEKKSYVFCGFAYVLSLTEFANFPATTEAEVTTLTDYFGFVLGSGAGEGQTILNNNDYLGLPEAKKEAGNVLDIARKGVAKIAF